MSAELSVVLALVALGAAGVLWFAVEGVNRRPWLGAAGLYLWLLAWVAAPGHADEWFQLSLGGINVSVPDVLCSILGGIAFLRFAQGRATLPAAVRLPLLLVVGTLLLGYLRGVATFGLQHATNEFREFFYVLTTLAFSLSFPFQRLGRHLPALAVAAAVPLILIGCVRFIHSHGSGLDMDHRPLPSYGALAVGEAFFLGWMSMRHGRHPRLWLGPVLISLPFAFFLLHRSVWMSLLAGLGVLLLLDRPGRSRLLAYLGAGILAASSIIAIFFQAQVGEALHGAVDEATSSEDSTFVWRVEGWTALLSPDSGFSLPDILVGRPMGSGYARRVGESVVDGGEIDSGVIPHNYFVSLFLRSGAVGLVAFIALYWRVFAEMLAAHRQNPARHLPVVFAAVLVMQLVYDVAYSTDFIQALLLGGALVLGSPPQAPAAPALSP